MGKNPHRLLRWMVSIAALAGFAAPALAQTAPLEVMSSGGFAAAYQRLESKYTAASGQPLHISYGSSMGDTPTAIPARLTRGEPGDVVIMVKDALDQLVAKGLVDASSETDLANSWIGMAVKSDRPYPDISTPERFVAVLHAAKSVDYSDSASGVYLSTVLFPKLGLGPEMKAKGKMIPGDPVGPYVARGEADIGFQQVAELMPIPGLTIHRIPDAYQKLTIYAAAVVTKSTHKAQASAFIRYLASPAAAADVKATGLEPIAHGG